MLRRWSTKSWAKPIALACAAALAGAACSSSGGPLRDASSVAPELSPAEEQLEASDAVAEMAAEESAGAPAEPEPSAEPESSAEPAAAEAPASEPAEPKPAGQAMVDFFEIGRGDRVADLGGISGYSIMPIRRAVGPSGVVYVRRRSPPPTAPSDAGNDDLGKIVWMNTPDEAPLIEEANRLNAVTLMFAYHAVVAAGRDRKKLNAAVHRALVPGGVYIIADNAAPPGSGYAAARELSRIEDTIIRQEVQAAGFEFVEAGNFMTSAAAALRRPPSSQYVLKFRKL